MAVKHGELHVPLLRVGDIPELVHGERHRHQEQNQRPCAQPRVKSRRHRQPSGDRQNPGQRHQYAGHGNAEFGGVIPSSLKCRGDAARKITAKRIRPTRGSAFAKLFMPRV
jgi:hypothetical protein